LQTALESGDVQRIGDCVARAFLAPWKPRTQSPQSAQPETIVGDPLPNVARDLGAVGPASQALSIGVDSLRPLRWKAFPDASRNAASAAQRFHRFTFDYDPTSTIGRPAGISTRDCVP
jgi:hypothetical protein